MGQRKYVLNGDADPLSGMGIFVGGMAAHCKAYGHSTVCCAKTAEPIEMSFRKKTRVDPRNHVLDAVQIPLGKEHF